MPSFIDPRGWANRADSYDARLYNVDPATLQPYQSYELRFVGRDPLNCTIDKATRRLTCNGKASGCVATPTGVVCPPGTSLSGEYDWKFSPIAFAGILIGAYLIYRAWRSK